MRTVTGHFLQNAFPVFLPSAEIKNKQRYIECEGGEKSQRKSRKKDLYNIKIELEATVARAVVCRKYIKASNLRRSSLRIHCFPSVDDVMQNGFGINDERAIRPELYSIECVDVVKLEICWVLSSIEKLKCD